MDDRVQLQARNEQFIAACGAGLCERLRPILDEGARYLDGRAGQVWDVARYAADLRANPSPSLRIDELVIHVAGQTATVATRTFGQARPGRANRYLVTYPRRNESWLCVYACVWPLGPGDEPGAGP